MFTSLSIWIIGISSFSISAVFEVSSAGARHSLCACLGVLNSYLYKWSLLKYLRTGAAEDQKSKNVCACFRNFIACILPVWVGKNKINPSRKENGPHVN
jgi:hypothetical protein